MPYQTPMKTPEKIKKVTYDADSDDYTLDDFYDNKDEMEQI